MSIVALATLPLLIVAAVLLWDDVRQSEARLAEDRIALARAAALAAGAFVGGDLATLSTLAAMPAVRDPAAVPDLTSYLASVAAVNSQWEGVGLIGPDGWAMAGSLGPPREPLYVGDRPYFQGVIATGQPYARSAIIGRARGVPTIPLSAPVEFSDGRRGVLVAPLPPDRLAAALRAHLRTDRLGVVLIDQDGQSFVHPDPDRARSLAPIRGRPDVDAALAGETGSQIVKVDGVETLVAYAPIASFGWAALVAEPTVTALAPVRDRVVHDLGLLGVALMTVGGIGWVLGGRLSLLYERLDEAREQAEFGAERAAFLADASRELSGSLDYDAVLARVVDLAVPAIADWSALHVVDEPGDLRLVAVDHVDSERVAATSELMRRHPSSLGASEVLSTGLPRIYPEASGFASDAVVQDRERQRLLEEVGVVSAMVVPLVARGQTFAVLQLVRSESGRPYEPADLAVAEGLARRAALAAENARLYSEVQRSVTIRDEFLASVSHDLRSPLASIKATAQVLQLQLDKLGSVDAEGLRSALSGVDATATRMNGLISGLLDAARLQMGRALDLDRRPTDVVALARRVAAECERTTERHRIIVEGEADLIGEWDGPRLERVVSNVLDNAVKYSPEGGEVRVALARENGREPCAVLTVQDQGLGIPGSDLEQVFDRFHRGSNVDGRIGGTGMGLAGARQIVEQHGGTITVESQQGVGTTVSIRLPLGNVADPSAPRSV